MSGFDRLGRELEAAAKRARGARWSRRVGSAGSAVAMAAALATVAVIVVGALVLLHGRRAPTPAGSAPQPAPAAQGAAWARLLSCGRPHSVYATGYASPGHAIPGPPPPNADSIAAPAMSEAAPDPRLLAALGVLRRPWTSADAVPATTSCGDVPGLFPAATFNVRYVRYVGPGPRGGKVFLVPAQGIALPALAIPLEKIALARGVSHEPFACLITLGGSPASGDNCAPLVQIERPLSSTMAMTTVPAVPAAAVRHLCESLAKIRHAGAIVRAMCLKSIPTTRARAVPRQVISAVVRDAIVTVDVYAGAGRARTPVLTGVPVHDNMFSFESGGAVTGLLTLVFKDGRGRVMPSGPVPRSTLVATSSVAGLPIPATGASSSRVAPLPSPRPSSASRRTAAHRRR